MFPLVVSIEASHPLQKHCATPSSGTFKCHFTKDLPSTNSHHIFLATHKKFPFVRLCFSHWSIGIIGFIINPIIFCGRSKAECEKECFTGSKILLTLPPIVFGVSNRPRSWAISTENLKDGIEDRKDGVFYVCKARNQAVYTVPKGLLSVSMQFACVNLD